MQSSYPSQRQAWQDACVPNTRRKSSRPGGQPAGQASARPLDWLVLLPQLGSGAAATRVQLWRRLQELGAVALKNGVHVLPDTPGCMEDFEWVVQSLRDNGAEGIIARARFLVGLEPDQLVRQFELARDAEYAALTKQARAVAKRDDRQDTHARLLRRLNAIRARDYFQSAAYGEAEAMINALVPEPAKPGKPAGRLSLPKLGTTWVTRQGVRVDRMASAWLIRRFIDPRARFRFIDPQRDKPKRGEVGFDMLEGAFTHQGGRCTFEVLLDTAGFEDSGLRRIAEMVHELDLRDGRYLHGETIGLGAMLSGIAAETDDDAKRISNACTLLDSLYRSLR